MKAPQPPRRRLATRLLIAQGLVIAAGGVTLALVAVLVSPPLFHLHVRRALGTVTHSVATHLDEAFFTSVTLSLGIGAIVAIGTALAVSWVLSSRIARPIEALSDAADDIASGELGARAPTPPANDEMADLTTAFNRMAATIESTEATRQRLLADLAHELRTPLSTVEGYLEGLADGVVPADASTWALLQDATARLRRLVDDVALVSRVEERQLDLALEPLAPEALVTDAVGAMQARFAAKDVALETAIDPATPVVHVDRQRVGEILANLLENALHHTPAGGRVTVRATPADGGAAVTVADTGEGIRAEDLPHVFERFYRADPARRSSRGSGIGLTIARAIAVAHGGRLMATSDGPGTGAAFTLWLPRVPGPPQEQ